MTSDVIAEILTKLIPGKFYGVVPKNELPTITLKPATVVANSDNSSQPGTHWTVFYFDASGNGEYFDPLGLPPLYDEWEKYLEKNGCGKWTYSSKTVQNPLCSSCGYHCIYYILMRCCGYSATDILKTYTSNLDVNDISVFDVVNSLVN